ncbi:hypothetical protein OIO90_002435 [Microbotryomycetes sp. JL221]|nr:hypothetical protein OIO90_002435 [Microbotryomycetes sp. JL221]
MAPRKNDSCSWKKGAKESLWGIKRPDSEPLLRFDLQYQVLEDLFSDRQFRFTAPVDANNPPVEPIYLNFDQLYLEAILSSTKTTPALRKKLIDNPDYASSFCKASSTVVHTMKTALRTYHPVPALQRDELTRAELQDAPRLKAVLKGCLLDWEGTRAPSKLKEIAEASASPKLVRGPPTTVPNAIFALFNEAIWVTSKYFPAGFDLLDTFYPANTPSGPRVQAFLTVLHHVLEDKTFINDFANKDRVELSPPIVLSREPAPEPMDVDTPDELAYVQQIQETRRGIVKDVPSIQKRDEEMQQKAAAAAAKTVAAAEAAAAAAQSAQDPAAVMKRRRTEPRSFTRTLRDKSKPGRAPLDILPAGWDNEDWSDMETEPASSSLASAWKQVDSDMLGNRDPDYESDDGIVLWDTLRRRQLITVVEGDAGVRKPVAQSKEYEAWSTTEQDKSRPEEGQMHEAQQSARDGGDMEE